MFYDILDKKRIGVLPLFKNFKKEFYLAGGTSLALQIGHRDSIDFDFFKQDNINTSKLFEEIINIFYNYKVLKIQEEKNTLTVLIDKDIKLSFFSYRYKLLKKITKEKYLSLASIEDIACMKLSAILSRASNKDYIDLYYIFKKYNFKEILNLCEKKFDDIDINLILKSLVYFDDVKFEPIIFKHNSQIKFYEVKNREDVPNLPPRHPNCRSIVIPVYKGDSINSLTSMSLKNFLKENPKVAEDLLGVEKWKLVKDNNLPMSSFIDIKNGKYYTNDEIREKLNI